MSSYLSECCNAINLITLTIVQYAWTRKVPIAKRNIVCTQVFPKNINSDETTVCASYPDLHKHKFQTFNFLLLLQLWQSNQKLKDLRDEHLPVSVTHIPACVLTQKNFIYNLLQLTKAIEAMIPGTQGMLQFWIKEAIWLFMSHFLPPFLRQ